MRTPVFDLFLSLILFGYGLGLWQEGGTLNRVLGGILLAVGPAAFVFAALWLAGVRP